MGFSTADYFVLVIYLIGVTLFGAHFRRSQSTVKDYFLGSRNVSWVIIGLSIVATETSTLTLIGVPALAYSTYSRPEQGGSFTYLQVVIGYIVGRFIVSFLLIPAYFNGECSTAYELIGRIFGPAAKRLAALMFLVMRAMAEGVRVFAASLVLSAVLAAGLPELHSLWLWSILIVGALTIIYTFEGGISAVIWTDLIQLIIYVAGALIAAYELITLIPGGWAGFVVTAGAAGKFQVFSFSWDFSSPFTFWGGVIGGTFLTLASHGTDQLIVQRLLASRNRRDGQKALIFSGFAVSLQFALFLGIGSMLFAYYSHYPLARPLTTSDQVFPAFIVQRLPHGIAGLVIAAIFAAAMSNLSGSLNALSSSTLMDFVRPAAAREDGPRLLRLSRWLTAAWGAVLICIAVVARRWGSVFTTGLTIASIVYGPMLGVFLLGLLVRRANQIGAISGMVASLTLMVYVNRFGNLAWTWYVVFGALACVSTGYLISVMFGQSIRETERSQ